MVKAILLGTSAAMVSTFASAADLPRKAAPAEYVQVCQGQGAGFFVIPGTTTCLKIGGIVRVEAFAASGSGNALPAAVVIPAAGLAVNPAGGTITSPYGQNNYAFGSRLFVDFDARTASAYGTIRSYGRILATRGASDYPQSSYSQGFAGVSAGTAAGGLQGAGAFNTLEAFVQFAGVTAGFTHSMFDFFGAGGPAGTGTASYSLQDVVGHHDTRTNMFAYTAQFGGGLSATVSLEDAVYRRPGSVGFAAVNPAVPLNGLIVANDSAIAYGANKMPDVVANVNYTAGALKAQIMGAYHDVRANTGQNTAGYAFGAGLAYKILPTTEVAVQGTYASGANNYVGARTPSASFLGNAGFSVFPGFADAYGNASGGISKTTAWSATANVNHFWSPAFRTALSGGYLSYDLPAATTAASVYDVKTFQVALTNVWMPISQLQVGLELFYENNKLGQNGSTTVLGSAAGVANASNSNVGVNLRLQRAF